MYSRVHSSVRPQQSHVAKSTSIAAAVSFVVTVCESGAAIKIESLTTVADITAAEAEPIYMLYLSIRKSG